MANAMPWSVRGIDPEIREQVVEAAQRAGMSVGQWLSETIAGNLDEDDQDDFRDAPRKRARSPRAVNDLQDQIERLSRPRRRAATGSEPGGQEAVLDLVRTTVRAMERMETQAAPAPDAQTSALTRAIKSLEERINGLETKAPAKPSTDDQLAGVLSALQRLQAPVTSAAQKSPPRTARMAQARPDPAGQEDDPAFYRALQDIEARRRELDGGTAASAPAPRSRSMSPNAVPANVMSADESGHIDTMRRQLDLLVSRIDDLRTRPDPENAPLRERLDHIAGRIEELRTLPRPDSGRLQDRLDQIASRLEEWHTRPNTDLAPIRRDLAALAGAIETLSPQHLVGMVERAVSTMGEKLIRSGGEGLSTKVVTQIGQIHDEIRDILRDIVAAKGSDRLAQDVELIARRLDKIGQDTANPARFTEMSADIEAIKTLIGQAFNAQPFEALARKIDVLGQNVEAVKQDPVRFDERPIMEAIADIRGRIEGLNPQSAFSALEARLGAIAEIETRLGAIAGIEAKLGELANTVSKLASDTKPLPQLDSIAERLERIDRVLDGSRDQPLAGLDTLATKLDKVEASLEKAFTQPKPDVGQHETLIEMLDGLGRRIEQAQAPQAGLQAIDALQAELARIGQRLDNSQTAAPDVSTIERTLRELLAGFDNTRQDLIDAAQDAAQRAVREVARSAPRDETTDTLAAEGLLLIKRDLGEFKTAQTEAERRTRQTLEALHSTLESLVTRLAQMETRDAMPRGAAIASPMPNSTMSEPAQDMSPNRFEARSAALGHSSAPPASDMPRQAPPPLPQGSTDASDLPLEPGQRPGMRNGSPAADAPLSSDPRANFIAAARKAAQAAADRSQSALNEPASGAEARPARRKLLGGTAAPTSGDGGKTSFISRARRPILLGLAAIVFALGALKVLSTRNAPVINDLQPPALEQSEPKDDPVAPQKQSKLAPKPAAPETTGSIGNAPTAGATPPDPSIANPEKRGQRLGDTAAISQFDPVTVGSIGQDGQTRPIETGRGVLAELAGQTNLKGQEKLRDAALSGNSGAIYEIGARLADGRGMPRDPKSASRWFEQAAVQGHAPSQYRLASLYREGQGVPKDAGMAFQWFDRAAAQGHVLAMHNAAVLLAEGVHGTPDYAGAALWFKRAAEHGVKDSQFNVAILFARGLGVNQDLKESFYWFSIAALQGDQDAAKKRDDIGARLPKDQITKERERVKAYKPNPANPNANMSSGWTVPGIGPAQFTTSTGPASGRKI